MYKIKMMYESGLSESTLIFQGNPQICDQKIDFFNTFTEQTQQLLCTRNS